MKLEQANIVCPKCGNGNYMRHLIGKNVGRLDMKCINCNSYFNFDELYKQKIADIVKPKTNADRIRSMTDEELAVWISALYSVQYHAKASPHYWLDWLREEANNDP